MSDDRLRALERRWRETGDPQDEATWLVARVRRGALEPERLAVAAACGHAGARLAAAERGLPAAAEGGRAEARALALHRAGGTWALVHLAVAVVERLLEAVPPERVPPMARDIPHDPRALEWLLEKARAWLACPCAAHGFRMPTHFWLGEHELAVDLAGLLHHAAGDAVLRGAAHDELAGEAAALVAGCAGLEGLTQVEGFRRAAAIVAARALA